MAFARTVFVGDVHGCRDEFSALLDALRFDQAADRVVLLGDFMDKGPDPVGVVRMARELGCASVKGNHDEKHVRYRKHEVKRAADPRYKNPMRSFSALQAAQNAALSPEDVAWLDQLPYYLQVGDWVAVHAGLVPGVPLEKQHSDSLCRVRWVNSDGKMASLKAGSPDQPEGTRLWMDVFDHDFNVVAGHAAHSLERPLETRAPNGRLCVSLDTGAAYGGHLSAFVLEENSYVQVKARKAYATWFGPVEM